MSAASPVTGRTQTICLVILTTLAVGAALHWLAPVMIPFVLAVFTALAVSPLIEVLVDRLRIPRPRRTFRVKKPKRAGVSVPGAWFRIPDKTRRHCCLAG